MSSAPYLRLISRRSWTRCANPAAATVKERATRNRKSPKPKFVNSQTAPRSGSPVVALIFCLFDSTYGICDRPLILCRLRQHLRHVQRQYLAISQNNAAVDDYMIYV